MAKAIFKQRNELMGVVVVFDCGVTSPEILAKLSILAADHGCTATKFTTRQTMVFLIPEEKVTSFGLGVERLGLQIGGFNQVVRNIKGCTGNQSLCPRSYGDALDLGIALQKQFMNQEVPKDFKISVAGCRRGCTDPLCADLGLIASGAGKYDLYLGGRGGTKKPLHGKKLLVDLPEEKIKEIIEYILNKYRALGQEGERICTTIDRVGLSPFIPPSTLENKDSAPSEIIGALGAHKAVTEKEELKGGEESQDDTFAKVVHALDNCCGTLSCSSCSQQKCVVGYAKIVTCFAKDNNAHIIPSALHTIPTEDIKIYDQETLGEALISTLMQCKECRDNHEHNCFINLTRLSLEIGLLGDNIPYDGTLFKYMMKVKEANSSIGDKILLAYQKNKKRTL